MFTRHPYRILAALLALAASVMLASCEKEQATQQPAANTSSTSAPAPAAAKKVKIRIVSNAVSPFWDPVAVGMKRAGETLGCDVDWRGPANAQVDEQRRILEEFEAQQVDGVAVSPVDSKAIAPVIDEMQKRGITVITVDSDAPETGRKAYIGTNNYNAGRAAGEAALKVLGDKAQGAKVIAFVGTLSAENARDRLKGFVDATKGKGVTVVDTKQDQTDKAKARKNAEDAIQANPDANLFLGLWSYNGPAIAQAVKAANKRPNLKVVCFDAEPNTLKHLAAGEVDATIVQKPYLFGYLAVQLLYNMKVLGVENTQALLPAKGVVDTGVEVITPENVKAYQDGLTKLGIKSS